MLNQAMPIVLYFRWPCSHSSILAAYTGAMTPRTKHHRPVEEPSRIGDVSLMGYHMDEVARYRAASGLVLSSLSPQVMFRGPDKFVWKPGKAVQFSIEQHVCFWSE